MLLAAAIISAVVQTSPRVDNPKEVMADRLIVMIPTPARPQDQVLEAFRLLQAEPAKRGSHRPQE